MGPLPPFNLGPLFVFAIIGMAVVAVVALAALGGVGYLLWLGIQSALM